tara:strand:- start:570 stop:980 length:411 start_codon:yes stop_codon:yes gene_type:complete
MSNKLLNKSITSCFAKIARVDGSIGQEEKDIMNSSKILEKYRSEDIEVIDTKNFFNNIQNEYGEVIKNNLSEEEKEEFISDLVNLIKSDDKVHEHEFFLLGHVANSIGYSPEGVAEIIEKKGLKSKSTGWFSWLFG